MSLPTFRAQLSVDLVEVTPAAVAAYLERAGWTLTATEPKWLVWARIGSQVVDVPRVALGDWRRRLVEAVADIARAEGRTEIDVARDLGMLSAPAPAPEGS